jgi:hypothetical protein
MANIRVKKTVLSKEEFEKAVDTSFTTFVDPQAEEDTDTVEELFRLYNKLYYEIPIEEDTNSHKFLIQESSKLVDFEKDLSDIQPLLDEITYLREQLLIVNQNALEIQTAAIENGRNQI